MKEIVKNRKCKRFIGIWAGAAIFILLLSGGFLWLMSGSHPVFTIDGCKVTKAEFQFFMKEKEGEARNYYQTQYGITLSGSLWQKQVDKNTPEEYLKDIAYEECTKTKSLFLMAKENELIDSADFSDFLDAVKKENEKRSLAVDQGEIVYGKVNFTPEEYLGHLKTELETNLIKNLSQKPEDPLFTTEEEILNFFNVHKEEWNANTTITKVWDFSVAKEQKESKRQLMELGKALSSKKSTKARKEIIRNLKEIHSEQRIFTADTYRKDLYSCMEVRSMSEQVPVNEVSTVFESEKDYHLIWVTKRQTDEEKAYKMYKARIREALMHEKFKCYLENYQKSLKIDLNNKVYRKIKIKL